MVESAVEAQQEQYIARKKQQPSHTLFMEAPCGAAHPDDSFCTHHSHREGEGAESSAARVVAATFQQRPRINTTDLILEMARKQGRKGRGRRVESYKRQSKSFAAWKKK